MKRFLWSCVAVALAAAASAPMGGALVTPRIAHATAGTVPVVRCRTVSAPGPGSSLPSRLSVLGSPRTVAGLVAYTNTELFLIGPARMTCSGLISQDGGTQLLVWPRGKRRPQQDSQEDGITLVSAPTCVGCQAEYACPFFAAFARGLGFPCATTVPAKETVARSDSHLVLFQDPRGVAGDGWPSGGPDAANGTVVIQGSLKPGAHERAVYRSTCTLPAREQVICTVSLNDTIARYR